MKEILQSFRWYTYTLVPYDALDECMFFWLLGKELHLDITSSLVKFYCVDHWMENCLIEHVPIGNIAFLTAPFYQVFQLKIYLALLHLKTKRSNNLTYRLLNFLTCLACPLYKNIVVTILLSVYYRANSEFKDLARTPNAFIVLKFLFLLFQSSFTCLDYLNLLFLFNLLNFLV